MNQPATLSSADLRHINALAVSFPVTGDQAIHLFQLVGKDRALVEMALIAAEAAGEDVYAGALRRIEERSKCATG